MASAGRVGACPKSKRSRCYPCLSVGFSGRMPLPTTMRAQAPTCTTEYAMRFYNQQHRFYCGVDLHARTMYLCILDPAGLVVFDQNLPAQPQAFLQAIAPFRDDLVVAVECLFCWYWLADLCAREHIPF